MKKLVIKCLILIIVVYGIVVGINLMVDPANIYHASVIDDICSGLETHPAVEIVGDFDEGDLIEKRVEKLGRTPETMVMGSSHVLYVDWQFDDFLNVGMSGEFMDDYYATVGLLETYDRLPEKLVIGLEPYVFIDDLTLRQESLEEYMDKAHALAGGKKPQKKLLSGNRIDRIKEACSFSYFQSSVKALVKGTDTAYVNVADNTEIGERVKLTVNGKRIPGESSFWLVEDKDSAAAWNVSTGAIYCMTDYEELSENRVKEWENLVDYLLSKGVDVEIYLPCWYPIYYDEFETNELFSGVIKAEEYAREMAAERGITVHGSYSPYLCEIDKEDYLDSFHLSPEAGLKCYEYVMGE